jgi:RimJ/RimL family protein N-acetyltransferase
MYSISCVTYKKATKDQLDLLLLWFSKPHVKDYWGDGGKTIPDFKKFTSGNDSLFEHFFAYYNGKPFAFLMTSEIAEKDDDFAQWREKEGRTLSFDFLIGEEQFLGAGFAHEIIRKFAEEVCADAAAVVTDPEVRNAKAIHVYEKAGFVKVGDYFPNEGNWSGLHHAILKKKIPSKTTNK